MIIKTTTHEAQCDACGIRSLRVADSEGAAKAVAIREDGWRDGSQVGLQCPECADAIDALEEAEILWSEGGSIDGRFSKWYAHLDDGKKIEASTLAGIVAVINRLDPELMGSRKELAKCSS